MVGAHCVSRRKLRCIEIVLFFRSFHAAWAIGIAAIAVAADLRGRMQLCAGRGRCAVFDVSFGEFDSRDDDQAEVEEEEAGEGGLQGGVARARVIGSEACRVRVSTFWRYTQCAGV